MVWRPRLRTAVLSASMALVACVVLANCRDERAAEPEGADASASLGAAVTKGAAPGYIEDRACAACHSEIYESYQEMGMAKSFYRPAPDKVIEQLGKLFYHEASQRYYEMTFRDGTYYLRRYQLDTERNPINVLDVKVDWVLGSGHNGRTYLYQEPDGEMYQLPLAWYTQTQSWGMAPGFDADRHLGVMRAVRRGCMFCHNAYPDVPEGSDLYQRSHSFPTNLPEGIGCQRCHGPGAAHVREARSDSMTLEGLRSSIVNPSRLEAGLRDDVCDQCHLQPSVALFGIRAFGRADYSFRPGESLSKYIVQMDIVEPGKDRSERFEINHHPYRLKQSRCFQESSGSMSCLTCHDPHRRVSEEERAEYYRSACLGCHEGESLLSAHPEAAPSVAESDCVRCHMQKRRTQDVVQLLATDHFIRRRPGGAELVAPLREKGPDIDDIILVEPEKIPTGDPADRYRAVAALRATSGRHGAAMQKLAETLHSPSAHVEPYVDLARSQVMLRQFEAARNTTAEVLRRDPDNPIANVWSGVAAIALGDLTRAEEILRKAVERHPRHAEAHYNLALVLIGGDRHEEARGHLLRATELHSHLMQAWYYLGRVNHRLGRAAEAITAYKRALALDPTHTRSYVELGEVLAAEGNRAEALRYYKHGSRAASQPETVRAALAKLTAN